MIELLKLAIGRLAGAGLVLMGRAVPVTLYDSDTTIVVMETEGNRVSYLSCRNYVDSDDSYNILVSIIFLWAASKTKFFWTADNLGNQVRERAEEYFNEHKKGD